MRFVTVAAVALLMTGCAASFVTEDIGPCSPEYAVSHPDVGSAYVRQAGKNLPIQWGVYVVPKYKIGSHFIVKVYADGVKIDGKNQDYEPHGSVSADRTRKYSGKILEITGTAVNGDDTLSFSAKCIIA